MGRGIIFLKLKIIGEAFRERKQFSINILLVRVQVLRCSRLIGAQDFRLDQTFCLDRVGQVLAGAKRQ